MVVKWTIDDPVTSVTYTFEVNPNEGGTPTYQKNVTDEVTTAPDGAVLLFEGQDPPKHGSFSGTILQLSQYQALRDWYLKRYPVILTDDLGRTQTIYITKFDAKRVRSALHPYKHTYSVEYIVIALTDL